VGKYYFARLAQSEVENSNDRFSCDGLLQALSAGQSRDSTMSAMTIATAFTQVCCVAEFLYVSYLIYVVGVRASERFYSLNICD
jgi:hypothetical protein